MTFSEDKLRIFKNVMLSQTAPIYVSHSELEALLARLEAAEASTELLERMWEAHRVVMSGGAWQRHIEPLIYEAKKIIEAHKSSKGER